MTKSRTASADPGFPPRPTGFDPLISAKYRWSGLLPTFKAPIGSLAAYIYTSPIELTLALWHELQPGCRTYGRVDVSADGARRLGLRPVPGFELCHPIQYVWEGKVHYYLPDVGSVWEDGPALAEAGRAKDKSSEECRAMFAAAREYLATQGGRFYILLGGDLTRRWQMRALWLHLWRFAYFGKADLLADIDTAWRVRRSPRSLITHFKGRDRPANVQHAVMKVAGDALAAGRLDIDLNRTDFHLDTAVRLL